MPPAFASRQGSEDIIELYLGVQQHLPQVLYPGMDDLLISSPRAALSLGSHPKATCQGWTRSEAKVGRATGVNFVFMQLASFCPSLSELKDMFKPNKNTQGGGQAESLRGVT